MSSFSAPIRNFFIGILLARGRLVFPINLRHSRIYVFPTRQGFIFFALLLAILFGSLNHNNNLGFLLTFLLGDLVFVSIFHTYRNLSGLELVSVKTVPVFAGQVAKFKISLKAPGHAQHALSFYFSDGERKTLDLRAGSKNVVSVSHETLERGLLVPNPFYISTTYPLGLFRGWSILFIDASCLVYPQPISGPMITAQGMGNDESGGKTGGEGVDDFAGLATYQPGDPLQRISWKSYSRGQGMHTKKFEGQLGETVFFDPDALGGRDLEFKLSRICHMILKAEAMHISYGLKLGNQIIEPGQGGSHKRLCLHALAMVGR